MATSDFVDPRALLDAVITLLTQAGNTTGASTVSTYKAQTYAPPKVRARLTLSRGETVIWEPTTVVITAKGASVQLLRADLAGIVTRDAATDNQGYDP